MKNTEATSIRKTATILLILSGTMAWLALLGWVTGHWQWLSLGTGCVPTAPATSILLILLNAILLANIFGSESVMLRWFCRVAAVLITVSGFMALLRPFFGWFSPLEQWMAGTAQTLGGVPLGQMSPLTGLMFLFTGSTSWIQAFRLLDENWSRRIEFGLSGLVFWISTAVILSYATGTPLFSDRPIIPMALWTAIIFLLLSVALALNYELAESPAVSVTSGSKKPFVNKPLWIVISSLIVFVIVTGGVVYLREEEARIQKEKSGELAAVGKLKVDQILRWRRERIADIHRFSGAPFLGRAFGAWLHEPDDAALKKDIVRRLKLETEEGIYKQALLMDADAHILFSFPAAAEVAGEIRDIVKRVWDRSEILISELHFESSGEVHVDIMATMRDESGRPLAVVVLTNDAREYLFPLLQIWPAPSRSAETVLVRRDGDNVLFLNDLKNLKHTALTLRVPLTKIKMPAVQAVLGKTGLVTGPDYRGMEVFADLRPVPGTSWYLVTKMDTEEILAEIRFRAIMIFAITSILIASLLGLIVLLYQIRLIKEREAAAKDLKLSEHKLDLALKSARMGVWQFDLVKNKRFFDRQVCAILGIDPATFGGTTEEFFAAVHPEDREKLRKALARTINDGALYEPEYRVVWSDGSIHDVTGRGELVCNDQGKPEMINGIIWDITERKKAEKALRQAEERYRELVEGTDDLITVVDKEGRFVFVSHSSEKIFGIKSEDCIGRLAFDFIHPGDLERTKMAFGGWVQGKERKVTFQNRQVHKDGRVFEMLWNINLHFDDSGEVTQIVNFARDITDLKQAEEKIKKINLELEERVKERTAELAAAVKELEAFGYSVAHDLKAPLRAMAGFANILSEDYGPKLDENAKRVIGVINNNAKNMGQMIDDLLELSRTGRLTMNAVDVDTTALVRSVCLVVKKGFSSDRTIETSVKPLPSVHVDPILIQQIFTNLISNAVKFTAYKKKAVIEIGSYNEGPECVYYVKDNGAGFDMKYKGKLFGIFQRIHPHDQFEGTGIGLAIVKSAVQRLGGRVWAQGEVGQGATFYFTLSGAEKLPAHPS